MKSANISIPFVIIAALFLLTSFRPSSHHVGEHFGGGVIIRLTGPDHGLIARADSMGGCCHWSAAFAACQNCHEGGASNWRLPTMTELQSYIFPQRANIYGLHYECTRVGATPECDCILSGACKCNYWTSETLPPAGGSGPRAQQVSLTTPNPCHQACSQAQGYCRVVAVHDF